MRATRAVSAIAAVAALTALSGVWVALVRFPMRIEESDDRYREARLESSVGGA